MYCTIPLVFSSLFTRSTLFPTGPLLLCTSAGIKRTLSPGSYQNQCAGISLFTGKNSAVNVAKLKVAKTNIHLRCFLGKVAHIHRAVIGIPIQAVDFVNKHNTNETIIFHNDSYIDLVILNCDSDQNSKLIANIAPPSVLSPAVMSPR